MVEFDCKYWFEIFILMIGIQIININNLSFCDFHIMAGTQKNLVSCVLSTKKHGYYFRKKLEMKTTKCLKPKNRTNSHIK